MMPREDIPAAFARLLTIMDELREQCPWDKKQTLESLRHLTIEETYELADAILSEDLQGIKEELGDLMLHMVFYARIASEKGAFNAGDVLESVCEKLIRRHPHIYGDVQANTEAEVKANWEKIKLQDKQEEKTSLLSGVPRSLPSMIKALRMQEKARGVGFDWDEAPKAWEKVKEELDEFEREQLEGKNAEMEEEFGDLLFSLINFARLANINPETALERTNRKFLRRFAHMEQLAEAKNQALYDLSQDEMESLWVAAKRNDAGL